MWARATASRRDELSACGVVGIRIRCLQSVKSIRTDTGVVSNAFTTLAPRRPNLGRRATTSSSGEFRHFGPLLRSLSHKDVRVIDDVPTQTRAGAVLTADPRPFVVELRRHRDAPYLTRLGRRSPVRSLAWGAAQVGSTLLPPG